jgi:Na+/melibiose symporter-like transporter
MLPDCVAYDAACTGRRQAGVFTGLWTAGETFGLALGPGILGLILQLFGYTSSSSGTAHAQSGTARLGIVLAFTVLPAVVVAGALVLLRGYNLTPERLASAAAAPPAEPAPAT